MAIASTPATTQMEFPSLRKMQVSTLQFNMGRLCNQACLHCHVESSPKRSGAADNASAELVDQVHELLRRDPQFKVLDLTGGAPELNPSFRALVGLARALQRQVYVRHNLTVQLVEGMADLAEFFAANQVILFCSLPCYRSANVDKQRGDGVFERSIEGLQKLNAVGYGQAGSGLDLHLVYNPVGPVLPPSQEQLELDYRGELKSRYGIEFTRLLTIANQPIHRYRDQLVRLGKLDEYLNLLQKNFNPATLDALMCRTAVSLRWDGRLYDCDFNLVQDLPMRAKSGSALIIDDLLADKGRVPSELLAESEVVVDQHCFACTAGCGSSCGGALA